MNLRTLMAYTALSFYSHTHTHTSSALSYSYAVEPIRIRQNSHSQRYFRYSATSYSNSGRFVLPFAPSRYSNRSINLLSYPRGGSSLTQTAMASTSTSTKETIAIEACPKLEA